MHLKTIHRAALGVSAALLMGSVALAADAPARFDGKWMTTMECPSKGRTEGYKIQLPSVVTDSNFRGERGAAGQPGYLLIVGKIEKSGKAKLEANGKVSSRKYATGITTTEGDDYSYKVNAQFEETKGTGVRDAGLGIIGRACTFDFVKQP
jgi:hypothetical protein